MLVALHEAAAHHPDVLVVDVLDLVLHVVDVGLPREHVVDRFVETHAIPLDDEVAPQRDETRNQAVGQAEILAHVVGDEGHVAAHVDDVEVIVRAERHGVVEQPRVEFERFQRFFRIQEMRSVSMIN